MTAVTGVGGSGSSNHSEPSAGLGVGAGIAAVAAVATVAHRKLLLSAVVSVCHDEFIFHPILPLQMSRLRELNSLQYTLLT